MGVILKMSTSQAEYFADDTVEGTVEMVVASKRPEGSRAHELKLNLVGRVRTTVTESRSNGLQTTTHNVVDDNNFLCQAVALGSFASGWVANGTHTFPFSFSLPPDVLPSLEEATHRGLASVRYSLKARLTKGQHGGFGLVGDTRSKLRLRILGRRLETVSAVPSVLGPSSGAVQKCCSPNGTMTIGCRVDRLEVRRDRPIELSIVVRNDSPLTVKTMVISINQLTMLTAHGRMSCKKRPLARVVVPGPLLAGAEPRPPGSERGQSLASIAQAAREDVQRHLAAEGGARYSITAPRGAAPSMEIEKIQIKHWLCVKLKTTGFNSSPELSVPVHVRPPETALPEARADPVDPSYATTVVGVGANGAGMPESVPVCTATVVGVDDMPGSVPAYAATVVQVGAAGAGMPGAGMP